MAWVLSVALVSCTPAPKSVVSPTVSNQPKPTPVAIAQVPTSQVGYPPEVVQNFIQGCAGQNQEMQGQCGCIIQRIQAQYTYAQYQSLVQANAISDPGIKEITEFCADSAPVTIRANSPQSPTQNSNAYLVGQDGAYLGVVSSDQYAAESICNQYGQFGSPYAAKSVWNKYAQYGGTYASNGAYNPMAQKPPLIIQNGQRIGILTKNPNIEGGTDPDAFFYSVCQQGK